MIETCYWLYVNNRPVKRGSNHASLHDRALKHVAEHPGDVVTIKRTRTTHDDVQTYTSRAAKYEDMRSSPFKQPIPQRGGRTSKATEQREESEDVKG